MKEEIYHQQQLIFDPEGVKLFWGGMRSPDIWGCFGSEDRMCSWCGIRESQDPSDDERHFDGCESIAAYGVADRVCPFCPFTPTDLARAVEIVRTAASQASS